MQARAAVLTAIREHRLDEAAEGYARLLRDDPQQVLPQQPQLDLANHLMASGRYELAAAAYERFLEVYPKYPERHQVQLVLGLLYAKYLGRRDRASELFDGAHESLTEADRELAKRVLADAV